MSLPVNPGDRILAADINALNAAAAAAAATANAALTPAQGNATYPIPAGKTTAGAPAPLPFYNVKDYGAKGDGQQYITSGSMTNAQATLTDATNSPFTSAAVGKSIIVVGAGAGGNDLITTITGYTSASQVTLAANAGSTVSGKTYTFGTDDTTAINACLTAVGTNTFGGCGTVFFPAGWYCISNTISVPAPTSALGGIILLGSGCGGAYGYASPGGTTLVSFMTSGNKKFIQNTANQNGLEILNMQIQGPGQSSNRLATWLASNTDVIDPVGSTGLYLQYAKNVRLSGVTVTGFAAGVHLLACAQVDIAAADIYANRNVGFLTANCIGVEVDASVIIHNTNTGGSAATTENVANVWLDGSGSGVNQQSCGITFTGGVYDEIGNHAAAGGACIVVNNAQDCSFGPGPLYLPGGVVTNPYYGIWVKSLAKRISFRGIYLNPFVPANGYWPTNTIKIDAGATDIRLQDMKTVKGTGGDISDAGTQTIYRNVNGLDGLNPATASALRAVSSSGSNVASGVNAVNQCIRVPVVVPLGRTSTGVTVRILTQSGNIAFALYQGNTQVATTGSVACPATGVATLNWTAPLNLPAGYYMLCLGSDNTTVRFECSNDSSVFVSSDYQSTYPPPATWAAVGGFQSGNFPGAVLV